MGFNSWLVDKFTPGGYTAATPKTRADTLAGVASNYYANKVAANPTSGKSQLRGSTATTSTDNSQYNGATTPFVPTWETSKKTTSSTPTKSVSSSSGSGSGSSTSDLQAANPNVNWQNKTTSDLADMLGITDYKYDDILANLNANTSSQFDAYKNSTARMERSNLRAGEAQYMNYLDSMRADKANSLATGITKGTQAANRLLTMLANNQTMADTTNEYNEAYQAINDEELTARGANATDAMDRSTQWNQYIRSLATDYQSNDVNELIGRLAANAQVKAAGISASGTTSAAQISANSALSAAKYQEEQLAKVYAAAAAGDMASMQRANANGANYTW